MAEANLTSKKLHSENPWPTPRRGSILVVVGGLGTALLMMNERQLAFGVPLGILLMGVCVWGALDWLSVFSIPRGIKPAIVGAAPSAPGWLRLLAIALLILVATVIAASRGVLPGHGFAAGVLVTASLLAALVCSFALVDALGFLRSSGDTHATFRRLASHPSLWLLVLAILLYVPYLGNFGLIDPWETHYGEVAREILARDDWMSLWWAQDGWFNSKPILDFWIQSLAFASLGVNFHPDGFVSAVGRGLWPQPEWAARLPMVFFALVAHATLYAGLKAFWGRRAAFLGNVVWLTTPFWFLIVHQTMTDLPYIAPMAAALGLFLLGFAANPDQLVLHSRVKLAHRNLYISGAVLVFGMLLLCTVPQILYLVSRNVTLVTSHAPRGFNWHWDEFFAGSGGGNCGLPGNEPCHGVAPVNLHPQPLVSAILWSLVLWAIWATNRSERRKQRLYFLAAWILIALSALAKELPGVLIAVGAVGSWVLVTKRWDLIKRLELPSALLIFAVITVPWYLQETVRHGAPFLERLLVHDMYKRAFLHVHDTNSGDDVSFRYYIWQLGYGLFPVSGLCAMAYLHWMTDRRLADARPREASTFLFLWSLVAFGMFTLTLTKFHHYIIPMVPPLALLTGPLLHQALWRTEWPKGRRLTIYVACGVASAVALLVGITWMVPADKAVVAPHLKQGISSRLAA